MAVTVSIAFPITRVPLTNVKSYFEDVNVPGAVVIVYVPIGLLVVAAVVTLALPLIPLVSRVSPFTKPLIVAVSNGFGVP